MSNIWNRPEAISNDPRRVLECFYCRVTAARHRPQQRSCRLGREPRLTSRVSLRQQSANYDRSRTLASPQPSLRHVSGPKAPPDDCPFRKFHPAEIRVVRQNHRIILIDVCDPARTRYVHLRSAQVSVPARRQLLWFEVTRHPPAEGLLDRSPRPSLGHQRRPTWCATMTVSMGRSSRPESDGYSRPADLTPGHRGKMGARIA